VVIKTALRCALPSVGGSILCLELRNLRLELLVLCSQLRHARGVEGVPMRESAQRGEEKQMI
jgi:hypothetical protein